MVKKVSMPSATTLPDTGVTEEAGYRPSDNAAAEVNEEIEALVGLGMDVGIVESSIAGINEHIDAEGFIKVQGIKAILGSLLVMCKFAGQGRVAVEEQVKALLKKYNRYLNDPAAEIVMAGAEPTYLAPFLQTWSESGKTPADTATLVADLTRWAQVVLAIYATKAAASPPPAPAPAPAPAPTPAAEPESKAPAPYSRNTTYLACFASAVFGGAVGAGAYYYTNRND